MSDSTPTHPPAPEGYKVHTENTTHVLLPDTDEAFLNPVQEFNRDLSVACITVWSEEASEVKRAAWEKKRERQRSGGERKRRKTEGEGAEPTAASAESQPPPPAPKEVEYTPYKFTILEALSATGLRSIRYAKEIPLVRTVIANDLSPAATEAIKRNVAFNGLSTPQNSTSTSTSTSADSINPTTSPSVHPNREKIQVNQGDACSLMYRHREPTHRVDVVDLDPYGTAAPFMDAGVQCVNDGGLLCVTCTDLTVLATNNYPEKCFSNYGGVPLKGEYCHEAALRLLLHSLSTSASRYGRYIVPVLSLSIDFYVRVFVKVFTKPEEVKRASAKTSTFYICSGCQAHYEQPLVRVIERTNEKTGSVNRNYKIAAGPAVPQSHSHTHAHGQQEGKEGEGEGEGEGKEAEGAEMRQGDKCPECASTLHIAGPMWSGPLHDPQFIGRVLKHIDEKEKSSVDSDAGKAGAYGTVGRMRGMLSLAQSELDTHFYFTPSQVASAFRSECPPLDKIASALLHASHSVSRSHACGGSLKTTATRAQVHDIYRSWIKSHPVKMENVPERSPARVLLAKEPKIEANFKHHPLSLTLSSFTSTSGTDTASSLTNTKTGKQRKTVLYQQNPTANWGPGSRASGKRKRDGSAGVGAGGDGAGAGAKGEAAVGAGADDVVMGEVSGAPVGEEGGKE